ncbi:MAG: type II toxin-antitoxin system PemK/MazF family toxin [Chloroflexi bacterium]|nr:type II toxin-antitoxin system PemK/MazF family toxin [Chloroflexota bacterium]
MQRGEVWWANLDSPAGRRPVLLISRNAVYAVRARVTVAPITRTIRNIPAEVRLGPEDGMPSVCVVSLNDIVTIRKSRLTQQITTLSEEKMTAVARAIAFALNLRLA